MSHRLGKAGLAGRLHPSNQAAQDRKLIHLKHRASQEKGWGGGSTWKHQYKLVSVPKRISSSCCFAAAGSACSWSSLLRALQEVDASTGASCMIWTGWGQRGMPPG